jgi:PAS domain S-box-containing protein
MVQAQSSAPTHAWRVVLVSLAGTGLFVLPPVLAPGQLGLPILGWLPGMVAVGGVLLAASTAAWLVRRGRPAAAHPHGAAERALREVALDLASIVVRTPDGVIRHWSGGAERLFGYAAAEVVGRRAQDVLHTRFPVGGRRAAMAELLARGEWQGELRHWRKDGSQVRVATRWVMRDIPGQPGPCVVETSAEASSLHAAELALRAHEGRLRLAQEVAGIGTWEWNTEGDEQDWSPEQHALFGTDPDSGRAPTLETLMMLVHPDDRAGLRAAIAAGIETGEYEAEFRIRRRGRDGGEETRWMIGRGRRMPGGAGRPGPMFGVHVDITARKETEQRQALLIREVDHRAKNALAVVQAVLRLTRAPDQASFVRTVEGRVAALARAQSLLTATGWSGADLRALLEGELAPFLAAGSFGPSVRLNGPHVTLAPVVAQPLAMAVHELATNAVKHGALSTAGGCVEVAWSIAEDAPRRLRLAWTESGGPPLAGPPGRSGFGSRVLKATVQDQLGGRLEQAWNREGIACRIEIPLSEPPARDAGAEGAAA